MKNETIDEVLQAGSHSCFTWLGIAIWQVRIFIYIDTHRYVCVCGNPKIDRRVGDLEICRTYYL